MRALLRVVGSAAFCAALGTWLIPSAASSLEPKLRGARTSLKVNGDSSKYHLVEPGAGASLSLKGPGTLTLKLRAVQQPGGVGALGVLHVAIDGAEVSLYPTDGGPGGRITGRRDIVAGAAIDRSLKIGEGQRTVVLTAEGGPLAIALGWELDAVGVLTATPLVAERPDPLAAVALAPAPPEAQKPPALKSPEPRPEAIVPITVDASTPQRSTWPYFVLAGALATGFAGAVVWAVAANTDSSYNGTPEGPGRNGKLGTANDELHASMVLAGVAIGLAAAGTVGLIFQ